MIFKNHYFVFIYAALATVWPAVALSQTNHQNNTHNEIDYIDLQLPFTYAGRRTYTFAETLHRTFSEFEELFENILNIVTANVPRIARDAEHFLGKLSSHTLSILNNVNSGINQSDDLLNQIFLNFKRLLESLSAEFQNMATSIDQHFNWAVSHLNLTLINNNEEYDWWTAHIKQKLRTFNDTKLYQEGCQAVDAFIRNSTEELYSCCKITMKPMRSLCKSATSLVTEALHTIVDSIDKMQSCIEEKKSYMDLMLPCIGLAYDEITALVSRAASITREINDMLPMKIIYTRSCFAIVKVDMNSRKNEIESSLFPY